MKPYVAHDCKNEECNTRWLDLDDTNVSSRPPKNKYCPDCEVFGGFKNGKDPVKVARGRELAARAKAKREKYACLEDI